MIHGFNIRAVRKATLGKYIRSCYSTNFMHKLKIFEQLSTQIRHYKGKVTDSRCDELTLVVRATKNHGSKMDSWIS